MTVEPSFLRANMGQQVKVTFKPSWPVPVGYYRLDGFDDAGIWVTHADGHQRHILFYDVEGVELR